MTATTSTPTSAPAPSVPPVGSDLPPVVAPPRRRRRILGLVAAATLAVGGGTVWVATSAGDGPAPAVETVPQGSRYGSADAAERQTAPQAGQQYGSADAAEQQTSPDGPATAGQQYGSADAAEQQTTPDQPLPRDSDPRQLP